MGTHWFWWLLTAAVVVWYSTVTVYVAYKGVHDIREMFKKLNEDHAKRQVHK